MRARPDFSLLFSVVQRLLGDWWIDVMLMLFIVASMVSLFLQG